MPSTLLHFMMRTERCGWSKAHGQAVSSYLRLMRTREKSFILKLMRKMMLTHILERDLSAAVM